MCEPVTAMWIGAAVGGAIGGSQGGFKGALLGAGFGALGGYGLAGGFAAGGGSALVGGSAELGGGVGGLYAGAQGGGASLGGFGGIFGTGSFSSFIQSPGAFVGQKVIGFGFQAINASNTADFQRSLIANQQAELKNRQIVAQFNITREGQLEDLRQQNIGKAGAQLRGQQRVASASLGQVVDVGSAADITAQTAADTAYSKLLSRDASDFRKYQINVAGLGLQADANALAIRAENVGATARTQTFGAALNTFGSLRKRIDFTNFSFRRTA